METPTTQDDLSFLGQTNGVPQDVLMEVRLNLEQKEFESAEATGTREAFQAFMDAFPMSTLNQEALTAIQALDFGDAEVENSPGWRVSFEAPSWSPVKMPRRMEFWYLSRPVIQLTQMNLRVTPMNFHEASLLLKQRFKGIR